MNNIRVILWDGQNPAPNVDANKSQIVVYWRRFCTPDEKDAISIPQLIEENAESIRSRYLAMVYELGEESLHGKRVVDCLAYRAGFSFWWMTLITEKSNFSKSPAIEKLIGLLAFEGWLSGLDICSVSLFSDDSVLTESVGYLCERNHVGFESQKLRQDLTKKRLLKRVYEKLPYVAQSLIWLGNYVVNRWCLRGVGLESWRHSKAKKTFISYTAHCASESGTVERYRSNYWGNLPDVLEETSCASNWLHIYAKDSIMPTPKHAVDAIGRFNRARLQNHVTLDSFLSLRVILVTLWDCIRLFVKGQSCLKRARQWGLHNRPYWAMLRKDFYASLYGKVAVEGLLFRNLFEAAFSVLSHQTVGVYLQENQGWEAGCVQAWKKTGHTRLVAVPHSTVRFWDLRYHSDSRTYGGSGRYQKPRADVVACNGPVAKASLLSSGYPESEVIDVEALRYSKLIEVVRNRGKVIAKRMPNSEGALRMLVLGDFLVSFTHYQLSMLNQAVPDLHLNIQLTVKPHPLCPVNCEDYPNLNMTIATDNMASLLASHDVAYSGLMTSAAVDAYIAGLLVISVLDPGMLNLSPVRGCQGVLFVSDANELAMAIHDAAKTSSAFIDRVDYFFLDEELPRWKRILLEFPQQ